MSCRIQTGDDEPAAPSSLPSSTILTNLSVSGTRLVSVFATYAADAPVDRMHRVFSAGIRMLGDSRRHRQLTMVASASALPDLLGKLRSLPWISVVEVDSVGVRAASSEAARRRVLYRNSFFRRRTGGPGPWGILFTGAHAIDSATGNTGSGVKVGLIDSGVDCSNSDIGLMSVPQRWAGVPDRNVLTTDATSARNGCVALAYQGPPTTTFSIRVSGCLG